MLSLRLFGGLSLSGPDGPIGGRASQRRRLALLAILAVARGKPVSRDKIVALLWPDADSERARHLLADSLYVLRDCLGDGVIVVAGDDLSLEGERIRSDTMDFDDALDGCDRPRAVAAYAGGAFMDGIHLSDAPEFERWVDGARSQFAARYRRALEELGNEASAAGDHGKSIEWWRMLAAEDRLSSRVALGLMRALTNAGDRAGALQFAQVHEGLVRTELEAPMDPSVAAYASQLRASPVPAPPSPATISQRFAEAPGRPLETASNRQDAAPPATPARLPNPPDLQRRTRRRAWLIAPALVLLAVATWGAVHLRSRHSDSIAVLPLDNMSTDPSDESFAAGMTEELIASLAKIDGLRVIASTSTLAFKGHHTDIRTIGDSLHVANVLEGGFQRVGSRIRLNLRLVGASDGTTRWSDTYNREAKDVFEVQDDIGAAVASALRLRLLGAPGRTARLVRHSTTNVAAYDWYLRGQDQQLYRTDSGARLAVTYFTHAVAEDSTFAAGYAGLAHAYTVFGQTPAEAGRPGASFELAKAAARKAISLDDSLVEGHTNLAYVSHVTLDLGVLAAESRRAIALDPRDQFAHLMMAVAYCWMGRFSDQLAEIRLALDADPLSPSARAEYARALFFAGRFDEALAEIDLLRDLRPRLRRFAQIRTEIFIAKKMWPQAIAEAEAIRPNARRGVSALYGYALAASGDSAGARRVLDDFLARQRAGTGSAYAVAMVYMGFADLNQTFAWLDRAVDDRSMQGDIVGPLFARLHGDPRYNRLRSRIGLQKL